MKAGKVKRRKKVLIAIICVVIIILISIIAFVGCEFYKFLFGGKPVKDLQMYTYGSYLHNEYAGGTVGFMPRYDELTDYRTLRFEYTDSSEKNSIFHRFPSSYVLDVVYNDSKYLKEKDVLFEKYSILKINDESNITQSGKFTFYLLNELTGKDTVKVIAFSDELTTVKYVVLEDIWGKELMGCAHAISWSNIGFVGIGDTEEGTDSL